LANDLTRNANTPRDQAKALYDWVARNIAYAGDDVGVGSVVPHEADVVLANRMGDCKDHTALLQALLASKDIASTPALINSGDAYTLPDTPAIETFDHVITYIPSLDLYADSTSQYTPFGSLPSSDAGKPVVLTANFTGIRRTPTIDWRDNGADTTTVINIHSDGSADGETMVEARGYDAEAVRYTMAYLQPNLEDSLIRQALAAGGFTGTGVLIKGDLDGDRNGLADSYRYGSKYTISDAMNLPGPAGMSIHSPFASAAGVATFLLGINDPDHTVDFACDGALSTEEFTIHLPAGIKVLAIPKNVELTGKYETYKTTYQLRGSTLKASREIEDRTSGPVCPPAVASEYKKFSVGVKRDLRAQLLYE